MARLLNFTAGPSAMPLEVLKKMEQDIVDYKGKGISLIETSHRGGIFEEMYSECLADFREVLKIGRAHV